MIRKIEIETMSTLAGTADCSDRYECPAVLALSDRPDVYHLVVKADSIVTDAEELAALRAQRKLADDEIVVTQDRRVIDALRGGGS
jgi:hypothetical protein